MCKQAKDQIRKWRRQQGAVDHVQYAAEPRNEAAAVFYLGVALHHAFQQIAGLTDGAEGHADEETALPRDVHTVQMRGEDGADDARDDDAAEEAFPGFAGAEPGNQLVSAEQAAAMGEFARLFARGVKQTMRPAIAAKAPKAPIPPPPEQKAPEPAPVVAEAETAPPAATPTPAAEQPLAVAKDPVPVPPVVEEIAAAPLLAPDLDAAVSAVLGGVA